MRHTILVLVVLVALGLTGCFAEGAPEAVEAVRSPSGFWMGLWHGMISWIAFIVGWFDPSVEIYERFNNGGWYDFGFLMGAGSSAGGCSSGVSRRRSSSRSRRETED